MTDQEKLDVIFRAVTKDMPRLEDKCDKHAVDIARVEERVASVRERLGSVERRSGFLGTAAGVMTVALIAWVRQHVPWIGELMGDKP